MAYGRPKEIRLSPLSAQREIVARLKKDLAEVDRLSTAFKRLAALADEQFKSELDTVFKKVKGESVRLENVCENLDSQRVPVAKSLRKSGPYPYYGASGVVDSVANYIFDGSYLLVSEDGANLIVRSTPIAFSVSGKFWVNNHAHILRFDEETTQKYVEYYFASCDISGLIRGAAQPKLTQASLNGIVLPMPNLNAQHEIARCIEEAEDNSKRLMSAATRGAALCEELRKSILTEAFYSDSKEVKQGGVS